MAVGPGGLETAYRNAAIICGAMAASTLLYVVAVGVVSIVQSPFEGFAGQTQSPNLRVMLWTAAVLEAGLIGVVRRSLLARHLTAGPAAQAQRLVSTAVVVAALAEVPAILGLVLFMLFGLRADFYALLLLSLGLQAVYFPRLDGWREWAAAPGS